MTPTELAYMAAIIDVMGSIRVRLVSSGTRLPSVTVSSPQGSVLGILAEHTGTGLITVKRDYDRRGCSEHCDEPHDHIDSNTSRWNITGAKATIFLGSIVDYMRIQQDAARSAFHLGLDAPKKPATLLKMIDIGWDIPREWSG